MQRLLEAMFRHSFQLMLLTLLPILIASAYVLSLPRAYEASATLWALQRYSVIGATGPESDLSSTPASTQATALAELLQTRSFSLAVAKETDLASTMSATTRNNPSALNDALFSDLSTKVVASAIGYNLYQITYVNADPKVAKQVVAAVIDQFGAVATQFSVADGKQLLATYTEQLTQAQKAADAAAKAAARYLADHPGATVQNDPLYSQLVNQAQGNQSTVLNVQTTIAQINQQLATFGNDSGGLYNIIDSPAVGDRPVSRTKTLLLGGGIGLAVALLGCSVYLVLLLRQDRSAHTPSDMQRITDLPVLLELPYVPATVTVTAINGSRANGRGRRRLRG